MIATKNHRGKLAHTKPSYGIDSGQRKDIASPATAKQHTIGSTDGMERGKKNKEEESLDSLATKFKVVDLFMCF